MDGDWTESLGAMNLVKPIRHHWGPNGQVTIGPLHSNTSISSLWMSSTPPKEFELCKVLHRSPDTWRLLRSSPQRQTRNPLGEGKC
jgi:hypothetical protein